MRAIWEQRRISFRRSKGDGTGDSSHGSGGGVCVGGKGDADKSGYSDDNAEFKMSGRQRRKAQNAVTLIRNWVMSNLITHYELSTRRMFEAPGTKGAGRFNFEFCQASACQNIVYLYAVFQATALQNSEKTQFGS